MLCEHDSDIAEARGPRSQRLFVNLTLPAYRQIRRRNNIDDTHLLTSPRGGRGLAVVPAHAAIEHGTDTITLSMNYYISSRALQIEQLKARIYAAMTCTDK
jgi:hypothetical protein